MSWGSRKKKEVIFLYRLFCSKEKFLTFVFYLNYSVLNTFVIYNILYIKKYQKILLRTLLLLVFKTVESLQCILNVKFLRAYNYITLQKSI